MLESEQSKFFKAREMELLREFLNAGVQFAAVGALL